MEAKLTCNVLSKFIAVLGVYMVRCDYKHTACLNHSGLLYTYVLLGMPVPREAELYTKVILNTSSDPKCTD